MERREGFERERIPEPPREVRREMPERVVSPTPGPMMGWRPDLTHWGAVWSGFFISLGVMVLVAAIGVGLGFTSGTNLAIWAAVTLIVGFFCGGWFAARTSGESGQDVGLIHGAAVWAVGTVALLILGAVGLGGAFSIGGFGNLMGAAQTPAAGLTAGQVAGWSSFVALILGLIGCLVGGYIGGLANRGPYRSTLR